MHPKGNRIQRDAAESEKNAARRPRASVACLSCRTRRSRARGKPIRLALKIIFVLTSLVHHPGRSKYLYILRSCGFGLRHKTR